MSKSSGKTPEPSKKGLVETSIFARTLKQWFKLNGWPQSIPESVARAKGNEHGPWGSQISYAMKAKHVPQPAFFVAMSWFNMVVATRDFSGITDRGVLDKLKNSQPLCHDNGEPYTGPDFFSLYVGLLEPSAEFQSSAEITQEDVDYWQNEIRLAFREIVLDQCSSKKEVWVEVNKELTALGISPDDIEWCKEMICEIRNATVDEARRQRQKYSHMPILEALQRIAGGNQERLGKLVNWLAGKARNYPEAFPQSTTTLNAMKMYSMITKLKQNQSIDTTMRIT